MATPADDHSEKVLVFHEWLNVSPDLNKIITQADLYPVFQ
jgi:hypothetical protein